MSRARMLLQYGLFSYIFASAMFGWYTIFKMLGQFLTRHSKK
jgi:hypothetical protein